MNALTDSEVEAKNQLFSTLDPTSRRLRFPREGEVVITDTVGFIADLPNDLVTAFRATLEELADADLLLHVVDAADPDLERKLEAVDRLLEDLELAAIPRLLLLNKTDLMPADEVRQLARRYDALPVSAHTREGIDQLVAAAEARLGKSTEPRRYDERAGAAPPAERRAADTGFYRLGITLCADGDDDACASHTRPVGGSELALGDSARSFGSRESPCSAAAAACSPAPAPRRATRARGSSPRTWLQGADGLYDALVKVKEGQSPPLVVYFYTDWCGYCRQFERELLGTDAVKKSFQEMLTVRINPEKGPARARDRELLRRLRLPLLLRPQQPLEDPVARRPHEDRRRRAGADDAGRVHQRRAQRRPALSGSRRSPLRPS